MMKDCVLVILVSIVSTVRVNAVPANSGVTCTKWPNSVVTPGTSWQERCSSRTCTCGSDGQVVCEGPTCSTTYHSSHQSRCQQWSNDGCCCERLVCQQDGHEFHLGDAFTVRQDDSCQECTCTEKPVGQDCVPVDCAPVGCVDMTLPPDKCCYICPNGENCRIPPLDWPANGEIGPSVPLPLNITRMVFSKADQRSWSCTCTNPGSDADCSRQARLAFGEFGHSYD